MSPRSFLPLAALLVLPGCLARHGGSLEVLNPKQAYGRSLAVAGDLHRENGAIEAHIAAGLKTALSAKGLVVMDDAAKADLVVVPTMGRMRERGAQPRQPAADGSDPASAEPVVAAAPPETRQFTRAAGNNLLGRKDLVSRGAVPSARAPSNAQQAGLLLTAYRSEDYRDYGIGRQSLPPVWRIYVSQPALRLKWKSVAVPLINAAASAAKPLAQGGEAQNAERKVKKEEHESREDSIQSAE